MAKDRGGAVLWITSSTLSPATRFIEAEHAYRLAQSFSKFYAACPVLAAPDLATRGSRLRLAEATLHQLERALNLLGIETPDRM